MMKWAVAKPCSPITSTVLSSLFIDSAIQKNTSYNMKNNTRCTVPISAASLSAALADVQGRQ